VTTTLLLPGSPTGASIATLQDGPNATVNGSAIYLGGNTLYVNQQSNGTFSGLIEDSGLGGALFKDGPGTLTLAGANTYIGGTSIFAGTLALSGVGSIGSIASSNSLTIYNGATFDISGATPTTFTASDFSTLVTAIAVSNLSDGSASPDGSSRINLGSNTLYIYQTNLGVFSGVIRDGGIKGGAGGSLFLDGGGILVLAGANTYTGGTSIFGGSTLALSGAGSIASSSSLTIYNTSIFDISGATPIVAVNNLQDGKGTTVDSSAIYLGGNTLYVNQTINATFSGVIQDGGLSFGSPGSLYKDGTGTLTLAGDSTYTGATTVNAGTLSVTGSLGALSNVTVNNGGTLAGTGTIGGNVAVSIGGGTLAPGAGTLSLGSGSTPTLTPQTLSIGGSLTLSSASNYVTTINGSNYTTTSVGGLATLAGTITISGSANTAISDYIVLSAGSLSGTFSNINVTGNFGNNLPTISYVSSDVVLNLVAGTLWQGSTGANGTDWGTAANWQGGALPTAVAAFDNTAKTTTVAIGASSTESETVGAMLFNADAPAFTFNISHTTGSLTLNGYGIVNESTTTTPTFNNSGTFSFQNSASAGNAIINTLSGGLTAFYNNSTGGSAAFNTSSGGTLDFSASTGPNGTGNVSAGAINNGASGAGVIYLGTNELTVSSGNFSGVISACGTNGKLCLAYPGSGPAITGGSLVKIGTGTLTLSGANTYSGGTELSGGTIAVGASSTPTSGTVTSGPLGTGTLTFDGGTLQAAGKFTIANAATVNSAGTIDSNGNIFTYSGAIGGTGTGGLTIESSTGAGTVILSNTNGYTGPTTINSGTLEVDGTLTNSLVTVNSGVLSGTGTIVQNVQVNAGGTLAPGSVNVSTGTLNPGTLNISGSLTMTAASYYLVTVNGSSTSTTNVTGTATITGANLALASTSAIKTSSSFIVLTATGGVTGTFNTQALYETSSGLYKVASIKTIDGGTEVQVTFAPATLSATLPPGFASFQNAINAAANNGTLPPALQDLFLLSPSALQTAASQLSGLSSTALVPVVTNMQSAFTSTLLNPNIGWRGGAVGSFGPALGFAPETQTPQQQPLYNTAAPSEPLDALMRSLNPYYSHSVWASLYGGYSSITGSSDIGSPHATIGAGGIASGMDFRLGPDTVIGFGFGGGLSSWNVSGLGSGTSDMFQAGFYGSQRFGNAYISGALAYAFDKMDTSRTITVPELGTAGAKFDVNALTGRLESGYRFGLPDFGVTPYVGTEFTALRTPAYTETGDPSFTLSYGAETTTYLRAEAGAWVDKAFRLDNGSTLWLFGRAAYAHDWWNNDFISTQFVSLPTESFTMTGITPPSNLGLASAVGELRMGNGMSFGLRFDGEFGSGAYSLAGSGTFRYSW